MTEEIKETITSQGTNTTPVVSTSTKSVATKSTVSSSQTIAYLIYFMFGVLEALLAFRLIFKLMGASTTSSFVSMIYGITRIFILPFEGIFRRGYTQGLETTSVLEPSTLVAIVVYALLAWGIVKLFSVLSGEHQAE